MGKLFGTDGIRGVVGENLTADLAFRTGKAIAAVLKEEKGRKPVITIGKDTRISSDMLESALIAGICSVGGDVMPFGVLPNPAVAYMTAGLCASGMDVYQVGPLPTPAISFLTRNMRADLGVVISASHNPYEHNGIKVFNEKGYKLPDAIEEQVEEKILTDIYPAATHGEIGVLRHGLRQSREAYIDHLAGTIEGDLSGLRVLVDCSNGASSATAPELFGRFRCFCDFIHREPDGVNINDHCGSTHLDDLAQKVVAGGYDIGVAFDGDADRCLLVDEQGGVIDGDKVLAVCGSDMKRRGKLSGGTIVATVMSNLGLHEFCRENGVGLVCTSVGDRNVLEKMNECGYKLGGEQSGHTIFTDYATTGDGQLTALQFLDVLARSGKKASELASVCPQYPQVLLNVAVSHERGVKDAIMASDALSAAIAEEEGKLSGEGRVLVRPSGTEALIRVMVEAKTEQIALLAAENLVNVIKML